MTNEQHVSGLLTGWVPGAGAWGGDPHGGEGQEGRCVSSPAPARCSEPPHPWLLRSPAWKPGPASSFSCSCLGTWCHTADLLRAGPGAAWGGEAQASGGREACPWPGGPCQAVFFLRGWQVAANQTPSGSMSIAGEGHTASLHASSGKLPSIRGTGPWEVPRPLVELLRQLPGP